MRVEGRVFAATGAFFAAIGALYWLTSYEDGGSVLLAFTACLGALPGTYLLWWSRRMRPRPEDRPDAAPGDGAGVVGAFPDQSVWPLILGAGAAITAVSLVFGIWLALLGGTMIFTAFIGAIVESRRGGLA